MAGQEFNDRNRHSGALVVSVLLRTIEDTPLCPMVHSETINKLTQIIYFT